MLPRGSIYNIFYKPLVLDLSEQSHILQ